MSTDTASELEVSASRAVLFRHVELSDELPITPDVSSILDDHPIRFLHRHQCAEIGLCIEGSGVFVVGEKVLEFAAGDVTFINHTEAHLARSMPGTRSRWHWIYLDPLRMMQGSNFDAALVDPLPLAGKTFANVIHPGEAPQLGAITERIVDEFEHQHLGFRASLVALTAEFMIMLRRARPMITTSTPNSADGRSPEFDRIAPAIALIARNFAEPLSVADLARACSMSEPTLRRAFAVAMKCSPRDYWMDVRLQMAASMLRSTTTSVLDVSRAVGFTTLSSFNRLFLERYGATPRSWRKGSA